MAFEIDLKGKIALVTGGGRGIGAAIAEALSGAGALSVIASRTEGEIAAVADRIRSAGGAADAIPFTVSGESAGALVGEVIERHGALDVLVHAAGNQVRKPTLEFSLEDFDRVLDVHLRAAFALSKAAVSHMVEAGAGGSIILIGSMTSEHLGHPTTVAYNVAKAGLLGLTRTLAVEFASAKVRANAILPGYISTRQASEVIETPERRALTARTPMSRYGMPSELGALAVLLASNHASYITGEAIAVDGGWSVA